MMNAARSTSSAQATLAEVEDCLGTLERLVSEPDLLASLPEPTRKALLIAAGRLSRPVRHERERVTKAIRRYRRKLEQQADLELRQTTEIRDARRPPEESSVGESTASGVWGSVQPKSADCDAERQLNQ